MKYIKFASISFLSLLLSLFFPKPTSACVSDIENNDLYKKGYLDVTLCGANPADNGADDTTGLQAAIDYGKSNFLSVFLPNQPNGQRGVYLVSDTLRGWTDKYRSHWTIDGYDTLPPWNDGPANNIELIGSTKGNGRPLLKLKSGASGFNNISLPKPVVWLWTGPDYDRNDDNPYHFDHDMSFDHIFRGIDIDLNGNSGAIGIMNPAAQTGVIEDTKITATGGFAGVRRFGILSGGPLHNVEVVGGRYGVFVNGDYENLFWERHGGHGMVFGSTFRDQEVAAFYLRRIPAPVLLTGVHITGTAAPILNGNTHPHAVTFVDSIIELNNGGKVIANGTNVFFRNVYVKGANEISNGWTIGNPSGWTRIKEYSYTNSSHNTYNLVNGSLNKNTYKEKAENQSVTLSALRSSLVDKHRLLNVPSFEDSDAVNVKNYGAKGNAIADDTQAIQNAINANEKVFIPKGSYRVSKTIELKPNTKLFGSSKVFTVIFPLNSWNPVGEVPIIRTANNKNATTFLADLRVQTVELEPMGSNGFTAINWRAGRNSTTRDVTATHNGRYYSGIDLDFNYNYYRFKFSDGGGGRHFSPLARIVQRNGGSPDTARSIKVTGTTEPLAIYGFNSAREPGNITTEIINAQNVRIYYTTHEGSKTLMRVTNSQNVAIFGGSKNYDCGSGRGCFEFQGSSNVLANNYLCPYYRNPSGRYCVKEDYSGSTYTITAYNNLSLFKRGEPSFTPIGDTPPTPGDGNNDGLVDGQDFVIWLTHYGQYVSGASNGDYDGNDKIEVGDYIIWINNFGT